ncbi:hypothetical protein ACF98D_004884 [Escherichia coli]|uniref:hypothetical protein n=1 Tax=Escherichia TaxID=561 RepID=UPI00074331FF|nr:MULTISPECIES: hypothetical protein [Escherichia]EJW7756888.1 hypothetical protein [Escherichia coli]TGH53447.1 hypothetical protein E5S48_24205 [Escherichia coli]HAW5768480.1 hypothetical protein [Escherichia coli]
MSKEENNIRFNPEHMTREEMVRELLLLRSSRDLTTDIYFEYVDAGLPETTELTAADTERLKAGLPAHHLHWLGGDGTPLTVRRISDFADVADDFSCLAAAIDPELAEPPEEGIPMEGLNGTLFCFIQEEDE